jgi:hypothetical protein
MGAPQNFLKKIFGKAFIREKWKNFDKSLKKRCSYYQKGAKHQSVLIFDA